MNKIFEIDINVMYETFYINENVMYKHFDVNDKNSNLQNIRKPFKCNILTFRNHLNARTKHSKPFQSHSTYFLRLRHIKKPFKISYLVAFGKLL